MGETVTYSIRELRNHTRRISDQVQLGKTVIITNDGEPTMQITRPPQQAAAAWADEIQHMVDTMPDDADTGWLDERNADATASMSDLD